MRPRGGHHGASSGIGEATARALTRRDRVALLARRVDRIETLAGELGDGAIAVAADVTDRDSSSPPRERVQDELGGADALVNNAGVMLLAPFTSTTLSTCPGRDGHAAPPSSRCSSFSPAAAAPGRPPGRGRRPGWPHNR